MWSPPPPQDMCKKMVELWSLAEAWPEEVEIKGALYDLRLDQKQIKMQNNHSDLMRFQNRNRQASSGGIESPVSEPGPFDFACHYRYVWLVFRQLARQQAAFLL